MTEIPEKKPEEVAIHDFYARVGKIVRAWAGIESRLFHTVSVLLMVDQFRARVVLESMPNIRARKEFLSRLFETYLSDERVEASRPLIKRLGKLASRRNLVVHAHFYRLGENDNQAFRDKFGEKGLEFERTKFTDKELDDLVFAIERLDYDLLNFLFEIDGHVHTSARTHREQQSGHTQ